MFFYMTWLNNSQRGISRAQYTLLSSRAQRQNTFTDYFPRLCKVRLQHISSVIVLTIAPLDKVVKKIYIFQQLVQKRIVIFSNYYQMSVLIFLVHFVLVDKILSS